MPDRSERILLSLKKFDFLTRDQLQRLYRLGSVRNTNRVLSDLSEYLVSFRDGYQSIYYLSKAGKEYVQCQKIRKKGNKALHTVTRNEFWLFYGCPPEWKNEVKVSDGETTVIADALFNKSSQWYFLEVDLTQPMKENRSKIERYKRLYSNGALAEKLGHFPTLIWLTTTEMRRQQLNELCESIPCIVFTTADIQ